ncbi:hypothetical protein BASA81_007874 [Batrachochytrium salamandrivorans]|nr:hypothetical protein BASA81_007874 [Batrachochytrium salamandrivorans]
MPSDEALERFDRLREVGADGGQTTAAFLAKFQSIAASLKPDERIKLVVYLRTRMSTMELLKAVLADPHASKISSLKWWYNEKKDVNSIVPLLTNNCPELASLEVYFKHHSAFDFVSSMLECPSNKLKVLLMPPNTKGDSARFFVALGQSQVSAIDIRGSGSPEFAQGLHEYLAKDLLVRLDVRMDGKQVPSKMVVSLANCTRLAKLEMLQCKFSQSNAFTLPKSVTKLVLFFCTFVDGFDWSFLIESNVRDLDFYGVNGVDGNRLGGALAVQSRAKGLDKLRLYHCYFVNGTLAAVGVELDESSDGRFTAT